MKAIEAEPKRIDNLFLEYEFEIPEYQRPYSWGKEECEQLWDDLSGFLDYVIESKKNEKEEYFLGSIVLYRNTPRDEKVWYVVDGQQRLITLLMLIRALYSKVTEEYSILHKYIYKTDHKTGDVPKDKSKQYPRIKSNVLAGKDEESLTHVLKMAPDELCSLAREDKENLFYKNYNILREKLETWWEKKSPAQRGKIIKAFRDKVVLLPIRCTSQDDALTLFQVLNDRGQFLTDADIFKAQIYKAIPKGKRREFMEKWEGIEFHEDKFRIYMHISRAKKSIQDKEISLRKYMMENHLGDKVGGKVRGKALASDWKSIMRSLEICQSIDINSSSSDSRNKYVAEEDIYWGILGRYPNKYWSYPLYVFLHKYMKESNEIEGYFYLPDDMWEEYVNLLQDTTRYFYIKGVAYNSINSVKVTTYKVCTAIVKGNNYKKCYQENAEKDRDSFISKLTTSNDLKRYRSGIACLVASLNGKQNRTHYGKLFWDTVEIEHILPKTWNGDGWDKSSREKWLNSTGNLVPLEKSINRKVHNQSFKNKQKKYIHSEIQDVRELWKKNSWKPEDAEKRHGELLARLKKFFDKLYQ